MTPRLKHLNGALLLDKEPGYSSFEVIHHLQQDLLRRTGLTKKSQLPKMGHGGTLDPFATGLLVVCVGQAVKLARYFLGAQKTYEGTFLFGHTTTPGDPTGEITERSTVMPASLQALQDAADHFSAAPYLQTPPMHSAKKLNGRPLYELAREGIEVERKAKECTLYEFEILDYTAPRARFRLICSSGTYVRTLAQDLARHLGTVGLLENLRRTSTGAFQIGPALKLSQIQTIPLETRWDQTSAWIPFNQMLTDYGRAQATREEAEDLFQGRQKVLFNILRRSDTGNRDTLAIYQEQDLIAIARQEQGVWGLERVFGANAQ